MSDYSDKVGKLSVSGSSRSGGKQILEWEFQSPFRLQKKDHPKLPEMKVKVAIDNEGDTMVFIASCPHLREPIRHADINALHKIVEEKLLAQHDVLTQTKWEDWLEVKVDRQKGLIGKTGHSAGFVISYERMKRCIHPESGQAFTITDRGWAIPFPKPKKVNELDEGSKDSEWGALGGREKDIEYSYIPATPENIAALDDVIAKTDALYMRLAEFLRQDAITASLVNLSSSLPSLPFSNEMKP